MREIKFRYWNTTNNMMVTEPVVPTMKKEEWTLDQYFSERGWIWMQYTGLTDKNGKEIYERDVIGWNYDGKDIDGVVEYIGSGFWVKTSDGNFLPNTCIVIGNIYENPELIDAN